MRWDGQRRGWHELWRNLTALTGRWIKLAASLAAGYLGRNLSKNSGGPIRLEVMGFVLGSLGPQSGIFGGGQVMAALEAVDETAVDVRTAVQVAVTPGTTLEPEHGCTSVGVSTLRLGLRLVRAIANSYCQLLRVIDTLMDERLPVRYRDLGVP